MNDKISVSERAVIQRINRKLKPDHEMLRKARGDSIESSLDVGDFYIINYRIKGVTMKDVDVEKLARELGVLKDWEKVAW